MLLGPHILTGVLQEISLKNLARWTTNIALQCVVGGDQLGIDLLDHLKQLGIDSRNSLCMKEYITSHYYAILDEKGGLYIACNNMEIYDHISVEQFTQSWQHWPSDLVIFLDTNLSPEIIQLAIEFAKLKNLCLCIDPVSVVKSAKLPDTLANVYLLKPNQDEASALSGITITHPDRL